MAKEIIPPHQSSGGGCRRSHDRSESSEGVSRKRFRREKSIYEDPVLSYLALADYMRAKGESDDMNSRATEVRERRGGDMSKEEREELEELEEKQKACDEKIQKLLNDLLQWPGILVMCERFLDAVYELQSNGAYSGEILIFNVEKVRIRAKEIKAEARSLGIRIQDLPIPDLRMRAQSLNARFRDI